MQVAVPAQGSSTLTNRLPITPFCAQELKTVLFAQAKNNSESKAAAKVN